MRITEAGDEFVKDFQLGGGFGLSTYIRINRDPPVLIGSGVEEISSSYCGVGLGVVDVLLLLEDQVLFQLVLLHW